ncbi:MAG: glycosyl transferase [Rhodospirillaceae bacterium]|nr:glycosyl transferase [Rhodospirillaceae bacterium]|tara:strand:- start:2747 stop:3499 length:753 start_codon:yes stop_codon:yes gene_type:complete
MSNIKLDTKNIILLLPVFNEGKSIYDLLLNVKKYLNHKVKVIIVDDKSTDDSLDWIKKFILKENSLDIEIIYHQQNQGLGGALNSGLKYCLDNLNFDILVTMDGDNTHDPSLISLMVKEIESGKDIVVASRYRQGALVEGIPKFRMFLSLAARICYSIAWNFHGIRDYTCLYRAYSISVLEKTFESRNHTHLNEKGFLASTELLRLVFKSSKNVTEIPIIINYSNKLQPSSMKIFKTIFKTLKVLIFKFD